MKVTANRLLNYIGHGGPKTEFRGQKSKIVSENWKSIFRSKLMPISIMIGPDETEKYGRFPGREFFLLLLHSVIHTDVGHSDKKRAGVPGRVVFFKDYIP